MSAKKIGYARVSKNDGSQSEELQIDALIDAGISRDDIYTERITGTKRARPELDICLKVLREGDTLVVWKLDRLGRSLKDLVSIVNDLKLKGVGFKVLTGKGAQINTETAEGQLMFGIFATLAEYESKLISERVTAGIRAARIRGRSGGRKAALSVKQIREIQKAVESREKPIAALCKEYAITSMTLYRYVSPSGELRESAKKVIKKALEKKGG